MQDHLEPFRESPPDRYCRLFPPARPPHDLKQHCEALTALGRAMLDDGSRVSEDRPEIVVDAGYTYFGQLVAHDLTKDVSSLEDAWRHDPEQLENRQTPRLDLSTVYGNGPTGSADLYEGDGVRLKVGESTAAHSFDICTAGNGAHVLADDRNAENMVLRQMTAVFARLHNFAVNQFRAEFKEPAMLFERARQQTLWQYQWLVCRDYLATLLDPEVYREVFVRRRSTIRWKTFSIPIEFSAAAMRFGHAMVRPNYLFAFGQEMKLPEMLSGTSNRGALAKDLQINWGLFFQGAGPANTLTTRPIDTRLAPQFQRLRDDLIGAAPATCPHAGDGKQISELPVRTLMRGAALRLATGQTAARVLGEQVLSEAELTRPCGERDTQQARILREAGLIRRTPLWYYVLKESEVRHNGNRVGRIGSRIIAETISAALKSDPGSFVNAAAGKSPPMWRFSHGPTQLFGLSELFRVAPLL